MGFLSRQFAALFGRSASDPRGEQDDDHLRCTKCNYDLFGLAPLGRCPECSRPVLLTAIRRARELPEEADESPDHPARQIFKFVDDSLHYPVDAIAFVGREFRHARLTAQAKGSPHHVRAADICDRLTVRDRILR